MARKIALFAREFLTAGTDLDRSSSKYVDVMRELHAGVDHELRMYGDVVRQRTSGVMLRVDTPSHGIRRDELPLDSQKYEAHEAFKRACSLIDSVEFVVLIRDAFSDTRGALAMYAKVRQKKILTLQQVTSGILPHIEAVYLQHGIENIQFNDFKTEGRMAINRYFQHYPMESFHAG